MLISLFVAEPEKGSSDNAAWATCVIYDMPKIGSIRRELINVVGAAAAASVSTSRRNQRNSIGATSLNVDSDALWV